MSVALLQDRKTRQLPRGVMKANVFQAPGHFGLEEKLIPKPGPGEAVMQVRLTTICSTDVQIVNGETPFQAGITLGHEAVGVIHELGVGITGYEVGQRVLVGAITPCGQCEFCLGGHTSQCGGPLGGWRLGNSMDGTQAEYVLIPHAQANLAVIPNALSDEQVLLLSHIASTGFAAAERANIHLGDTVAVFAQGPVGICATLGARLLGAAEIIAVDEDPAKLALSRQFGATTTVLAGDDPVGQVNKITDHRGVDVAIEALGYQETFESALRALRPGGTLSSVGVYCGHLKVPLDAFGAGQRDQTIVTTLCPGGKERMARLMRLVKAHRVDLSPLITHLFTLDEIVEAYDLFESHRSGVLKVGIRVS
jgi:threonine dehydrogenase-like Zn-dependent dehydrogenase